MMQTRGTAYVSLAACFALVAACASEVAPRGATVPTWSIDPDPVLQIGTRDGPIETTFGSVNEVLRTRAGSWVVVDGRTPAIRMFSASGQYLRTLGAKGDGPGEYRKPSWMAESDSGVLVVYDSYAEAVGRVLQYDTIGNVLQSETHWHSPDASLGHPLSLLSDGSILFTGAIRSTYRRAPAEDSVRGTDGVVRWNGGDKSQTLVRVPGQLLTNMPLAWFNNGVVTASDSLIYSALPDRYAIAVFTLDGTALDSVVRDDMQLRPVDAALQRRIKALSAIATVDNVSSRERLAMDSVFASLVFPSKFPLIEAMLTDTERQLWVRLVPLPDSAWTSLHWSVYSPSGEHIADIEQRDTRLSFRRIEADHIAGVWRDEDDVPYVRVHRLIKAPSRQALR